MRFEDVNEVGLRVVDQSQDFFDQRGIVEAIEGRFHRH